MGHIMFKFTCSCEAEFTGRTEQTFRSASLHIFLGSLRNVNAKRPVVEYYEHRSCRFTWKAFRSHSYGQSIQFERKTARNSCIPEVLAIHIFKLELCMEKKHVQSIVFS